MASRHSKLKIGIVGAGTVVKTRHLPALRKIPDVEVVAICNSSYESSEKCCTEYAPEATPYGNWAELVSLPDIDIVWIGTPPYLHSTVALSALEAGKHVFTQARMAMNLSEAEEMFAAAQRNPHLVTMVCPPPHGLRGSLFMQKLLAEDFLGHPHHLRLQSLSGAYINPDAPPHWRQRDELSGINVLTLGIYAEVVQRWFGPITHVFAHQKMINPVRYGYEIRIPDMVTVLCKFESGMEGVMEFSGVALFETSDRLQVFGNQGMLSYDFSTDRIIGGRLEEKDASEIDIPPELEQRWRVEEDFIAAVRSPASIQPQPSFAVGVQYMRVVQAVADSVALGSEVQIAV
ncbi:MAG: Gfo/Idh/MocA family oxidoreductase [Verrucomicrobia bacterium]|nr:Gfo/Idh/MocA family oxidoreductase [Verrucomicrobiota bacterium]